MTIPKRFEEVLEEAKLAEIDKDAVQPALSEERIMSGVDAPRPGMNAVTPASYNSSSGLPVVTQSVHDQDRITDLVQEFGLTAGGNKLTTWE